MFPKCLIGRVGLQRLLPDWSNDQRSGSPGYPWPMDGVTATPIVCADITFSVSRYGAGIPTFAAQISADLSMGGFDFSTSPPPRFRGAN